MSEKIICPSCGAEFESTEASCPYCGTMYLPGAENAYMEKLSGVHEELEGLKKSGVEETKGQLGHMVRRLAILLAVLLLICTGALILRQVHERREQEAERQDYLWRGRNFPVMEELYQNGEYDRLLTMYEQSRQDGHNVYYFKHSLFCQAMREIKNAEEAILEIGDDPDGQDFLLLYELELYKLDDYELSEEEYTILDEMRRIPLADFSSRFAMSERDFSIFCEKLRKDRFIRLSDCQDYLNRQGEFNNE